MLTRRAGADGPAHTADGPAHTAEGPGSIRERTGYELARLPREMTAAVTWYMQEHGITRRELAHRLGVTPGRVSQILSGDENLTLRTLTAVCAALDAHLQAELVQNKPADAYSSRSPARGA